MTYDTESHCTSHSSGITTTTFATVRDSIGNTRELYVLQNIGCSSSILNDDYLNYVKIIKKSKSHYSTAGSPYKASRTTLTFKLPEFFMSKDITWQVDMDSGKLEELGYGMTQMPVIGNWVQLSLRMGGH